MKGNVIEEEIESVEVDFEALSEQDRTLYLDDLAIKIEEKFKEEVEARRKQLSIPLERKTHTIVVKDGYGCIILEPDRSQLGSVWNKVLQGDHAGAGSFILDKCWIAGDAIIKNDDKYYFPAAIQACTVLEISEAYLKKN